jgi:hypothetical protein
MKKIDVSEYDHFRFNDAARKIRDPMSQLYKNGDYIGYIKSDCLGWFFSQCNSLFSMHGRPIPICPEFPDSGTSYLFQSFKKAGIADKVSVFNDSHSDFYNKLTPDFERIVLILTEHHKRWKALIKEMKAVALIQILNSKYKKNEYILGGDSIIYELYFIYENQYLHEQFDRFISAKDFYNWWDNSALSVLLGKS